MSETEHEMMALRSLVARGAPLAEVEKLVSRSGGLGGYLNLVESYERGDWTVVSRISAELCIEEQALPDLYIEACRSGSLLPI